MGTHGQGSAGAGYKAAWAVVGTHMRARTPTTTCTRKRTRRDGHVLVTERCVRMVFLRRDQQQVSRDAEVPVSWKGIQDTGTGD